MAIQGGDTVPGARTECRDVVTGGKRGGGEYVEYIENKSTTTKANI